MTEPTEPQTDNTPLFKLVKRPTGADATREDQKNWRPIIAQLIAGSTLFLPLADISDANVKYLSLALDRRGNGEKLRTKRTNDPDNKRVKGRTLWVEAKR